MDNKRKLLTLPGEGDIARRQEAAINAISFDDDGYDSYINSLSEKKRRRIDQSLTRRRHGMHTVAPISCKGPSGCPFFNSCPIPERDEDGAPIPGELKDYPLYRPCVFEMTFLQQKTIDYMLHLDVDPDNPIEIAIVNELAILDLYKQRGMLVLANGDKEGDGRDFLKVDIEEEQGEHGMTMKKKTQLHPVVALLNMNEVRRQKLLENLIETRKSKQESRLKLGEVVEVSGLRLEIEKIRRAIETVPAVEGQKKPHQTISIDDDDE